MAKTQKTLTVDREVFAALEERSAPAGLPVDEWVQRILRQALGLAQGTQPGIRQMPEPSLEDAYEAAWQEVDDAGAHGEFRSPEGTTNT